MGKSRFRMMPQSLFHKLRVNIRSTNCREDSKKGVERTISLPRSGYYQEYASSAGRGFESPRGPKQKEDKIRMDKNKNQQAGRKVKAKLLRSKSNSSRPKAACPVIETRVSTGCICRARVGSKGGPKIAKGRGKTQVLEKSFEVFEMENVTANPCSNLDLTAGKRDKRKKHSDSSVVSFDGAVREEKRGEKRNENLRRCSALCCTCRLSFSESFNESDDRLRDVDLWSKEEEEVEVPFLRNSDGDYDRLALEMEANCSVEDLMESAVTLFRRGDNASHAQVQTKLSQMIHREGARNEQKSENLSRNQKTVSSSVEFQTNEASCGRKTSSTGYNYLKTYNFPDEMKQQSNSENLSRNPENISSYVEFEPKLRKCQQFRDEIKRQSNSTGVDAQGRAKIDRGGSRQGLCWKPRDEKVFDKRKFEDKYASKGMRKISESFAIVKCSYDPRRDFTESMVEMIVENEIRNSHDLWELLHCYISLNSEEYREIILEVFEQVCSDLLRANA